MIGAFVSYLRNELLLPRICPKTVENLPSMFARPAEINFVINATWVVDQLAEIDMKGLNNKEAKKLLKKKLVA